MKPLHLRATNFRTFLTLDLELRSGLVGILGELRDAPDGADSNGAGKSSLLEAIDIALFGRRSLAGFLTRGGDVTELMLELTFEHARETYRVRRTFSSKTKATKTTVDLERFVDCDPQENWDVLTRSSTKETDALIVETIGLTRDTFRNSSYLRQGDGSYADPARDPKQRKDLLVEAALGRDPVWPKLVDAAKAARRTAQAQLERISGETRAARELVDGCADVVLNHVEAIAGEGEAAAALEQAEKDLQAVTDRYMAAKDAAARRQTVEAELAGARADLERLQHLDVAATEAAMAIGAAREVLTGLPAATETARLEQHITELEAAVEDHRRAASEHTLATDQAERKTQERVQCEQRAREADALAVAARAKIAALAEQHDPTCDRCGQTLADAARAHAKGSLLEEAEAHERGAARARSDAAEIVVPLVPPAPEGDAPIGEVYKLRAELRAAQEDMAQRARLEERIAQLQVIVDARPTQETIETATRRALAKAAELDDIEPVNAQALEAAGAEARQRVGNERRALDAAKTARVRLEERAKLIEKAEVVLAAAALQEAELQAAVDVETLLERACGRDGIPALIIENQAIPYIETVATDILHDLGTSFRVELRTQAALKSGDGLKDTLDVVVIDPDGNEAEFAEGTSGGEQTRIGLALRIALARLLASRRGAESRLLALDEPSYLDAAGMTALLAVLRGLQGEFDTILLVSHVPELRDSLDDAIVVVKDGGRSRIAGVDSNAGTTETLAIA